MLELSEFKIRVKTDMSDKGPAEGKPTGLPARMMGDRAFPVFAQPGEISGDFEKYCG